MCFLTTLLYTAFLQRPNLPHPPSAERSRPPYLDKRVPVYPDSERPRLPYPPPENRPRPLHLDERWHSHSNAERPRLLHSTLSERQRLPLKELDEKSWPSQNEMADSTPAVPHEEPGRVPSPLDEEEVDDYRILLQRHRLIQQQLAALEKQENSTLGEDSIIDDSFVDIPVEDAQPDLSLVNARNLESFNDSLEQMNGKEDVLNSQQLNVDRNMASPEANNEIYILDKSNDALEGELSEEAMTTKTFLPFKIKPRYSNVPSIKELSQKDLDQREGKKYVETAAESNNSENLPIKESNQTQSRGAKKRGRLSQARKNRRKRKRKSSQDASQSDAAINIQPVGTVSSNQGSHVDPHNELEARLMSLAGSSASNLGGVEANR